MLTCVPATRPRLRAPTRRSAQRAHVDVHGGGGHARPTLHLLLHNIRHGFGHGHTEHNLGESINAREREKGETRGRGRGGLARGTTGPRHATFGFIAVYPAVVRFPRLQIFGWAQFVGYSCT